MDGASGHSLVGIISNNTEVQRTLKYVINQLETSTRKREKWIGSDNGAEVFSTEFQDLLKCNGIIPENPHRPLHNQMVKPQNYIKIQRYGLRKH